MNWLPAVPATLLLTLGASPARANGMDALWIPGWITGVLIETVVPDLRYEIGEAHDSLLLTMPFVGSLLVATDRDHRANPVFDLTMFIEPQFQIAARSWRGVAGLGLGWASDHLGVYAEGGGVLGQDGDGLMAGGGLVFGNLLAYTIRLGARHTWADGGRVDMTVQVEMPITFIFEH